MFKTLFIAEKHIFNEEVVGKLGKFKVFIYQNAINNHKQISGDVKVIINKVKPSLRQFKQVYNRPKLN